MWCIYTADEHQVQFAHNLKAWPGLDINFNHANERLSEFKSGDQLRQNHRMLGVGRALCGSSSPPPLPKQGHLQQAPQDLVQAGLECLQRRRIHNLSGQPVPDLLSDPAGASEEALLQSFDFSVLYNGLHIFFLLLPAYLDPK